MFLYLLSWFATFIQILFMTIALGRYCILSSGDITDIFIYSDLAIGHLKNIQILNIHIIAKIAGVLQRYLFVPL